MLPCEDRYRSRAQPAVHQTSEEEAGSDLLPDGGHAAHAAGPPAGIERVSDGHRDPEHGEGGVHERVERLCRARYRVHGSAGQFREPEAAVPAVVQRVRAGARAVARGERPRRRGRVRGAGGVRVRHSATRTRCARRPRAQQARWDRRARAALPSRSRAQSRDPR